MKTKTFAIVIAFVMILVLFFINKSSAYVTSGTPGPVQPFMGINPLNLLNNNTIKNFVDQRGSGASLPSFNFNLLNTKNISSNDIWGSIKAIVSLAINLFLIVIQTVAGILKALLPFLSK